MVEILDTLVSLDLFTAQFCCDISQCHGQCCVEGDAGAPVAEDEIAGLEQAADALREELPPAARRLIRRQGVVEIDPRDGQFVTSCVKGRDCVFAVRSPEGHTLCAIDRAYREGRIPVPKPLSCALYPVRLSRVGGMTALNYHRWPICRPACQLGQRLQMPVFQFLKDPLIRAFGTEWWQQCQLVATELRKQGYI